MGGMGIFRVKPDGLNLGSIIEQLGHNGQQTLMVQQYQPAIAQGDKRVLLIAGEPVPYALARMPQAGEVRQPAAGGRGRRSRWLRQTWRLPAPWPYAGCAWVVAGGAG